MGLNSQEIEKLAATVDTAAKDVSSIVMLTASTEVSLEAWSDLTQPRLNWTKRPWVASFEFSYCTAPNAGDCTSGGDVTDVQSQLHYAVVAWPDTSAP